MSIGYTWVRQHRRRVASRFAFGWRPLTLGCLLFGVFVEGVCRQYTQSLRLIQADGGGSGDVKYEWNVKCFS